MTNLRDPVHFLLVDDREENLLALEALLRRDGLVLLKANSGPAALELLLVHEVALAFIDVQMPEMSGFELAELMRGTERTRRVPIIFLTAGVDDRQRRFRGYEAGAVDFLHKPLEPDILRSKAEVFYELFRQRQEVARQRDELAAAARALQEADRRKDEFLAMLAHELRNPLAALGSAVTILKISSDPESIGFAKDVVHRQVRQLGHLIDDLLDVSRMTSGKVRLRLEDVDAGAVLDRAVESARPLIDEREHELHVEVDRGDLPLTVDPLRLEQIVVNLLTNAAKYTEHGGTIWLSARSEADQVVIRVRDNGIGIAPDQLPRMFLLFAQGERSIDRSEGGLGIGLTIVKKLCEMHGGSITAASEGPGRGSEFVVRLPRAKGRVAADPGAGPAAPSERKESRILVVDDNVDTAVGVARLLSSLGNDVQLAHDGPSALDVAAAHNPEFILLDIGLPGMDGYQVASKLRKHGCCRDSVIIAVSGYGQEEDRRRSLAAGFDHHLVKPIEFEALIGLLSHPR